MPPRDRDRDLYPPRPRPRDERDSNEPDTDPPDSPMELYSRDEVTSVTAMALGGDVIAVKIKHLETSLASHKRETEKQLDKRDRQTDERFKKLEGHFEEKGMVSGIKDEVTDIKSDLKTAKSWIRGMPLVIGAIFSVITTAAGGVWWMIHSAERDHDLQLLQQAATRTTPAPAPAVPAMAVPK